MPATRFVHEGVYSMLFHYDYNGVSLSVSDIVVLGYIPQGAVVLDAYAWGSEAGGGTSTTFKWGILGADTKFGTAAAINATGITRLTGFLPTACSLSADAEGNLRIPIIVTKAAGTSTVTGSINLVLLLQAPPV
jgi:hypothetical protein